MQTMQHMKAKLAHVIGVLQNSRLAAAWSAWTARLRDKQQRCQQLQAALNLMANRLLAMSLQAWKVKRTFPQRFLPLESSRQSLQTRVINRLKAAAKTFKRMLDGTPLHTTLTVLAGS